LEGTQNAAGRSRPSIHVVSNRRMFLAAFASRFQVVPQHTLDARDARLSADFSGFFRHITSVTTHALAIISHSPNSLDIDKLGYKH
jgi:hypothetical protein